MRELFAQGIASLRDGPHGMLVASSEPASCDVYVNATDWILAGGLFAGGAALLVSPLITLAREGEEVRG